MSNAKFNIDPNGSPEELQLRQFDVSREVIHAFFQTPDGKKYATLQDNRSDGIVDLSETVTIKGPTQSEKKYTYYYSNDPQINALYARALQLYLDTYPVGSPQKTK